MFKKTLQILIIISLLGFISAYAQQDKPNLPKGQLLPAPLIVRSAKMVSFTETITSTVFEENFETGATSWSINGSWSIGAPTSGPNSGHNSIKCAGTNLSGNYSNNANDWLTSPSISLPELTNPSSQLKLNFWEWFEIESGYDHGKVKISTDGGTNWTELSDRSGSSDWRLTTVDISSYSGQTCKLVFHFTHFHIA
jgi:bacillopeptidase F